MRWRSRLLFAASLAVAALVVTPGSADAAEPPQVGDVWSAAVQSTTAHLNGRVNPEGLATGYHFDYLAKAAYEANVAGGKEPFAGALRSPPGSNGQIGSGTSPVAVIQFLSNLVPDTAYRYRLVAVNSTGSVASGALDFVTQLSNGGVLLADSRGWEMVSPVDKNGGQVEAPGAITGGGILQAAADGNSVTYGSFASFAAGALGAPPASQYVSTRGAEGWTTENLSVLIFSGSYHTADQGVPYQLFSGDLVRGLLLNGDRCRDGEGSCGVANPPLGGTDAPAGYQDYYLRVGGGFEALIGVAEVAGLAVPPSAFDVAFAGAAPDLRHVILATCAKLTADATEVPQGEGCAGDNLYEWSEGGGLSLVNILPGESQGTPGAILAAQSAVSTDGARVYFTELEDGALYLREAGQTKLVPGTIGGGASFQTASADGAFAFFLQGGHLYRYSAAGEAVTDLTPSAGVAGVLGASAAGDAVYYQDAAGLQRWQAGTTTTAAPGAAASETVDWPPAVGAARVGTDGSRLLFVSSASLTGYDNTDLASGEPDRQVYLYDSAAATPLTCVSCNPTGERPIGPSSIPGGRANGTAPGSTDLYKPRVLSESGRRIFFDSRDALVLSDTNKDADAYEWEAQGEGSCARAGGCLSLLSSGRAAEGASFVDASASGADAFFLTGGSLVGADPGAVDIYDARVGGGFPEPAEPIVCEGDNCQSLPPAPVDPTLTTLQPGLGNPPVSYKHRRRKRRHHSKRHRHRQHHGKTQHRRRKR